MKLYFIVAAQGCCRASVLLLKGRWFNSPGLHVEVSFGKMLNPKRLVGSLHGSHHHQCMNVRIVSCFVQKRLLM